MDWREESNEGPRALTTITLDSLKRTIHKFGVTSYFLEHTGQEKLTTRLKRAGLALPDGTRVSAA